MAKQRVQKFISTKLFLTIIAWLFLVMSLVILGCLSYMLHPSTQCREQDILASVSLLFIFFGLFFVSIIRYVLRKEQANRDEYEDKLFYAATMDSLTNIYNRRYFIQLGKKEFQQYENQGQLFSLLILDLDYFKKINDTHGHAIGDQALQHFSKVCKQGLRESDIIGRIGGEEFGIILPKTRIYKAQEIADRIRLLVAENPLQLENHRVEMTVSIGVTEANQQQDFKTLLSQADKALYQVKDGGRNRVIVYTPEY